MRIAQPSADRPRHPLHGTLTPGIYPYLGGSVEANELRRAVRTCGGAVVPGLAGARLARLAANVLRRELSACVNRGNTTGKRGVKSKVHDSLLISVSAEGLLHEVEASSLTVQL